MQSSPSGCSLVRHQLVGVDDDAAVSISNGGIVIAYFPEDVTPLLTKVPEALEHYLGSKLVGVYVYGSVLGPEFDPVRSDVDCIAVTHGALTDPEFRQLDAWLKRTAAGDPWFERLQLSFLIKTSVLREDREACLYQAGVFKRCGSDGNPIVWMDFQERGRTLCGAAPESFLPRITPEMLRQALVREVGYLQTELCDIPAGDRRDKASYRVYAVLTLCRILYTLQTGKVASKERAARWTLERVADCWHDLVYEALKGSEQTDLPSQRLCEFVRYTRTELRSAPLVSPSVGNA